MKRYQAGIGVLVCAGLLTACSGSSASAGLQGPLLISEGSWKDGMASALGGPVARVGTCIGIGDSMVVWPAGVSWDEANESLVLADGTRVQLGSKVYGGGGGMTTSAIDSVFGSDAADALRQCGVEAGADVTVFNVGGRVSAEPVT